MIINMNNGIGTIHERNTECHVLVSQILQNSLHTPFAAVKSCCGVWDGEEGLELVQTERVIYLKLWLLCSVGVQLLFKNNLL